MVHIDQNLTQHMVDNEATTAELALEKFRELFVDHTRLSNYDDRLVYEVRNVNRNYVEKAFSAAKNLIRDNRLPLTASIRYGLTHAYITIKSEL